MNQSDKSTITIRARPILRWGSLVMAGIFAIQLVWLVGQLLLCPSVDGSLLFTIILPVAVDCLMIGLLIYYGFLGWTMALIFDTTQLALRTIPLSPYRPFRIAYSEIVKVEQALSGYAFQIVTTRNTILRFAGFEFEGGPNRSLMELAGRLPAEKFSDEALAAAQYKSRWTSAGILFQTMVFPILLSVVLMGSGLYPSLLPTAWHKEDIQTGLPSVRGAAADPDGSVWLISDLRLDEYHIRHVSDGGTSDWAFPEELSYVSIEKTPDSFFSGEHLPQSFLGIARDNSGNPWVIAGGSIHQWDGKAWQTHAYPDGARLGGEVETPYLFLQEFDDLIINGNLIWGVDSSVDGQRILRMDIGDGTLQTQFLDLPDDALSLNSRADWIKPGPDGSLAVYVSGDSYHAFYLWNDGQWTKIAELEEERAPEWNISIDRDDKGNIYMVQKPRETDSRSVIGIFRPDQTTWIWSDVYFISEKGKVYASIDRLIVDSSGRIWMTGDEFTNHQIQSSYTELVNSSGTFYEAGEFIGVFQESDGIFQEVRHYTADNSGFSGTDLFMAHTGRIWAVGDYPAWIDSRQQDLPQPLPEWLAFITGDAGLKVRFAAEMILFFIIIVFAIYLAVRPPWSKHSRPKKD
jgi:hypothetical protein